MKKKSSKLSVIVPILVGLLGGLLCFIAIRNYIHEGVEESKHEYLQDISHASEVMRSEVERRILSKIYLARNLTSYVRFNPNINKEAFMDFAAQVYEHGNSEIISVQLVMDSIIRFNYPEVGNEVALNRNIIQIEGDSQYVREKIRNKLPMLIGPRMLLQNRLGMVYRDPIVIRDQSGKKELWGYSVMVIDINHLLEGINHQDDWNFALYAPSSGLDTSGFFYGKKMSQAEVEFIKEINILNKKWKLFVNADLKKFRNNQLFGSQSSINLFSLFIASILTISLVSFLFSLFKLVESNRLLKEKNRLIKEQLAEKNTLIREVHHRIKNHFQMMSSLNNILYTHYEDQNVQKVISEINSRVQSLSEVYNQLREDDHSTLDTKKYIEALSTNLLRGVENNIDIELDVTTFEMNVKKTAYLGVILNEMITNSLKYAFDAVNGPKIKIQLKKTNGDYQLTYFDNGAKLAEEDIEKEGDSKGIELLKIFALQLGGDISYRKDKGWVGYQLRFPS